MTGNGLIIGIDFTDVYCQASYYSLRHLRPESVSAGSEIRRYLIPSVLCYDPEIKDWAIGDYAERIAKKEETLVFDNLLRNLRARTSAVVDGRTYSYIELLALYFRKLIEHIQIVTSVMSVENVTVTMKSVNREIYDDFHRIFGILGIPEEKVKLLSSAECFSYFVTNEKDICWENGALLFDFGSEGFYAEQLKIENHGTGPLIFVNEYNFSYDFSLNNLASKVLRDHLDKKLMGLYQELSSDGENYSVFFTGEGFNEQWFDETLTCISDNSRAYKGSNIYVKGACIAGFMRYSGKTENMLTICPERTRHNLTVDAWNKGSFERILLSPAGRDWYDADYTGDFILENEREIRITASSVITGAIGEAVITLDNFGIRPCKATRAELSVKYRNEKECMITVTDKGLGDFFTDSGAEVSTIIKLDSV